MPNATAPPGVETWAAFADYSNRPPVGMGSCTGLFPCGTSWDAVAMPLPMGLNALDALAVPLNAGYRVLADYVRGDLYVLVSPGTGHWCAGPGRRVLGRGSWLLMPCSGSGAGSSSAVWLSHPAGDMPLVNARELAAALQGLGRPAT